MAPHGSAKSSTGGTKPGEHEPVDFLATGFKVKTNCAFSVKILENFKLRSDHLASEIKADEKGIEDFEGEMLRLRQRKEFLENRIVENKAWAANYDLNFGPFVNKYKEFMDQYEVVLRGDMVAAQMGVLYQNAKDKHSGGLEMLKKHFDYHPEFKRWSDTFSAVPFRPK